MIEKKELGYKKAEETEKVNQAENTWRGEFRIVEKFEEGCDCKRGV